MHFSSAYEKVLKIDYMLGHKQFSGNLRRRKSHQVSFPATEVENRDQLQEETGNTTNM